jgi:trigger factor
MDVKEETLPELDDDFAKQVGEGFENMAALRADLRKQIEERDEEAARGRHETKSVDALVEMATLDYPPIMVEREIDHILEDQSHLDPSNPVAQELYLSRMGKSREEVRESVKEDAERRLRRSLVMSQFAEAENIRVDESEVDAELDKISAGAGDDAAEFRKLFDTEDGRYTLRRSLLSRKTIERLTQITGAEPLAPAEPAKPARQRRTAPRKVEE